MNQFTNDSRKQKLIEALNDSGWEIDRQPNNSVAFKLSKYQSHYLDEVWLACSQWSPVGFELLIVWELATHPGAPDELGWVAVYKIGEDGNYRKTDIRMGVKHWPKRGLKEFLDKLSDFRMNRSSI